MEENGKTNGLASAADFRALASENCFGEPERVQLPKCGLAVMLRRPKAAAFALVRHGLPTAVAAALMGQDAETRDFADLPPDEQREKILAISAFWHRMMTRMFVSPGLSLTPGPDEISPDWIPEEDVEFLMRWARGEVASDGSDLVTFRGKRGRGEGAGEPEPGGEGAGVPAERPAVQ
jgi:hypothetical protein